MYPGMVTHTWNLSTWEIEEGGSPQAQSQLGLKERPCLRRGEKAAATVFL